MLYPLRIYTTSTNGKNISKVTDRSHLNERWYKKNHNRVHWSPRVLPKVWKISYTICSQKVWRPSIIWSWLQSLGCLQSGCVTYVLWKHRRSVGTTVSWRRAEALYFDPDERYGYLLCGDRANHSSPFVKKPIYSCWWDPSEYPWYDSIRVGLYWRKIHHIQINKNQRSNNSTWVLNWLPWNSHFRFLSWLWCGAMLPTEMLGTPDQRLEQWPVVSPLWYRIWNICRRSTQPYYSNNASCADVWIEKEISPEFSEVRWPFLWGDCGQTLDFRMRPHLSKTLYTVSRKPLHVPGTRWDTLAQ
jgi:hypothetical protein